MHRRVFPKIFVFSFCFISLCLTLPSCNKSKELLFHAGVGQRSSLNDIKAAFEKQHPHIAVNFSYKGSGYFIADVGRSKQGDLYMPGEEFYLLQAVEKGFIKDYDPKKDVAAYFITVIITPKGNPANIKRIEDFTKPGIRVGLGNSQACAIGLWHEKIFKKAGIWNEVQKNIVLSAKCIPELGNAAQHRSIDATIVWASTALLYLKDVEIIPIERKYRGAIRVPVATLTFSRFPREADLLKKFILSEQGKTIFHTHAYSINPFIPTDDQGFCLDGSTDKDMQYLINAAEIVKSEPDTIDKEKVGPLFNEVQRQLKTNRSGS